MQVGTYPTRNFALVAPHVAMRLGPYLYLTVDEIDGVWPLRIPDCGITSDHERYGLLEKLTHRSALAWPFLLIVRTGRIVTAQLPPLSSRRR